MWDTCPAARCFAAKNRPFTAARTPVPPNCRGGVDHVQPSYPPGHAKSIPEHRNRTTVLVRSAGLSLGDLQLDVPEIDGDIRSLQVEMGAIFNDAGLATTFGKKRQVLQALETGLVLYDASHWGRLRVAGEDAMALLANQSTADVRRMKPGSGGDTVFVTATGRCLDLATLLLLSPTSALMLIDSGAGAEALKERLGGLVFPGDKVAIQDISSHTVQLMLLGPEAEVVLKELAPDVLSPVLSGPPGTHVLVGFRGSPVFVVAGGGLGGRVPGFMLVADEAVGGELYAALAAKGAIPMGTEEWEAARILAGRPIRGAELTDSYNPLEAGLYGAVSLNKGCYIGQETLSKLHLRDGVNRQLWALRLSGPTEPGAEITSEMSKVGVVTSACQDGEGEWAGLGYLRSRLEGVQLQLEGVRVAVAGAPATVTAIPFVTRRFDAASESPAAAAAVGPEDEDAASMVERLDEAKRRKAQAQAEKQATEEAKLKAMQERVAAWQAAQQQLRQEQERQQQQQQQQQQ